jgi:outer membrane autotransporter protein
LLLSINKEFRMKSISRASLAYCLLASLFPLAHAQSVTDRVLGALRPSAPTDSRLATATSIAILCPAGNRLTERLQADCNALVGAAFQSTAGVADALGRITPDDASIQAGGTQNRALMDLSSQRLSVFSKLSGAFTSGLSGDKFSASPESFYWQQAVGDEGLASRFSIYGQFDFRQSGHDDGGNQAGFDGDQRSATLGLDGALNEHFSVGAAISSGSGDLDLDRARGGQEYDQRGFSLYANYFSGESFYVDVLASRSTKDIDQLRLVAYNLGTTTTVNQAFRSSFDSTATNIAFRAGWNFARDAWQVNPYLGLDQERAEVDAYRENAGSNGTNAGGGWAVGVNEQDYKANAARLGIRLAYAISTGSGVVLPFVDVRYVSIFNSDEDPAQVFFLGDTSSGANSVVVWDQFPDEQDDSFAELNVGLSAQFAEGFSGFLRYQTTLAQDRFDNKQFALGARFEF